MSRFMYSLLGMTALCACQEKTTDNEQPIPDTQEETEEESTSNDTDTAATDDPPPEQGSTPLFIVAGQSNAEGNVRLGGLEALQNALPSHNETLSTTERSALREAYRTGIGDWCNPAEDYSDEMADAAIDAFRGLELDISQVSASYTIDATQAITTVPRTPGGKVVFTARRPAAYFQLTEISPRIV